MSRHRGHRSRPGALAATGLLLALSAGSGPALAGPRPVHSRHVDVRMSDSGFTLPARIQAGWVTFTVSTAEAWGHQLEGFRVKNGAAPDQVVDDLQRAVSSDAPTSVEGQRDLHRDGILVGGPSADSAGPVSTAVDLGAGTYYFFDFDDFFTPDRHVTLHATELVGPSHGHAPRAEATVEMGMRGDQPRFDTPEQLPSSAWIAVRNIGGEYHEMLMGRVQPGTTDDDVQAYYESASADPAPYALEAPLRGLAAIDPGRTAYVRFHGLPDGAYALLCFAPDAVNGLPHVVEGMHAVVRLTNES